MKNKLNVIIVTLLAALIIGAGMAHDNIHVFDSTIKTTVTNGSMHILPNGTGWGFIGTRLRIGATTNPTVSTTQEFDVVGDAIITGQMRVGASSLPVSNFNLAVDGDTIMTGDAIVSSQLRIGSSILPTTGFALDVVGASSMSGALDMAGAFTGGSTGTFTGIVSVNSSTQPAGNAVFEVTSASFGMLTPRVTTASRDSVTWNKVDEGMLIYNTTSEKLNYFRISDDSWISVDSTAGADFFIDGNIGGGAIDLGTSDQSAYITPNSSALTLTQNAGSTSLGISCSAANDNTVGSTTCSSGNEEPGIVVTLPKAGTLYLCFEFAHQATTGTSTGKIFSVFQVVQTANATQTIGIEGNSRVSSGSDVLNSSGVNPIYPHNVCGIFSGLLAGKNTFRLMYEQDVTATVAQNRILADESASLGQRDVHVYGWFLF